MKSVMKGVHGSSFLKNVQDGVTNPVPPSFCLRTLHDHAFESGILFDTTLLNDQRALLNEIVEDFWCQHFYEASPLFISYVLESNPYLLLKPLTKIMRLKSCPYAST